MVCIVIVLYPSTIQVLGDWITKTLTRHTFNPQNLKQRKPTSRPKPKPNNDLSPLLHPLQNLLTPSLPLSPTPQSLSSPLTLSVYNGAVPRRLS